MDHSSVSESRSHVLSTAPQVGNLISFLWFHVKSASWLTPQTLDLCKGEWQQVICFIAVAPSTCATNKQAIERAELMMCDGQKTR